MQLLGQFAARGETANAGGMLLERLPGPFEFAADEPYLGFRVLRRLSDDCGVFPARPFAQFEHVAQDQQPPCAAAEPLVQEVGHGGPHARRVGVVAVHDECVAAGLGPLRAVVVGDVAGHGAADVGVGDTEMAADGSRCGDVVPIVFALEVARNVVGQRARVAFDVQRGALGGHGHQRRVLVGNEGQSAMCGQVVEQFPLAAPDPFRAAEALEMGASDVGQDAVVGFGDRGQTGDLAAGAGPHLDDPEFGVGSHGEQRERHADVVVEVAPGGVEGEAAAEHTARKLLGRGLAVAACDGEDRDAQRAAVGAGQLLQGAERVIDDEHPCIRARCRRVVGDGPCGPLGKASFTKRLPSNVAPRSAKKIDPGSMRRVSVETCGWRRKSA